MVEDLSSIDLRLIVISAPSGSGKNTIINALLKKIPNLSHSVSTTTRRPRPNEKEGVNYFFLSKPEFEDEIKAGNFIEWAKVLDNYYGTSVGEIRRILGSSKTPILDIDIQGALQVKKKYPAVLLLFIEPPSIEVLRERLIRRQTETPEQIEKRIHLARQELSFKDKFDNSVVNDDLNLAVQQIEKIIHGYLNSTR